MTSYEDIVLRAKSLCGVVLVDRTGASCKAFHAPYNRPGCTALVYNWQKPCLREWWDLCPLALDLLPQFERRRALDLHERAAAEVLTHWLRHAYYRPPDGPGFLRAISESNFL